MNIIKNLNFNWKYFKEFKEEYIKMNNEVVYEQVDLPHTNIELPYNNFDERKYQFTSCYKKEIYIPREYENKNIFISFEAVASYAKVYVNGTFAGEHKGGYTPFDIKIDSLVNFDEENHIVVVVDSTEREEIPPFGNVVDYLTYGGIYREVYLKVYEEAYIKDVFVKSKEVLKDNKKLDIQVTLSGAVEGLNLAFEIWDKDLCRGAFKNTIEGQVSIANAKVTLNNMELWDIDNPKLYTLKVKLLRKDEVLHEEKVTFGIREVAFKKDGFYLNGKKLKLRGLNRHQSYPYIGYAAPKSLQEKDAEILKKDLGVNIVRTSHYPQSKHFLNKCDEIGLLVFTEIPGWQHIGASNEWRDITINHVREMIIRDRNHPSIIIWGVRINESKDCDELYRATNALAHELDDTRPTGGVRNFAGSNLLEDVYTYNDFLHCGNNRGLSKANKIKKVKSAPYLVTENNGHMFPTKRFDNERQRIEHGLRHLRVLNDMYASEDISGSIGWCMADYNTHKDFGSGDRICYHGVLDMFRMPKTATYAYASQQEEYPVMEVSSTMDIGEHPAGYLGDVYVLTNCDYIILYKNHEVIGKYYPDRKNFKHLPHPPIVIDDFIGNQLQDKEGFSQRDAKRMKEVIKAVTKYGMKLPIRYKLKMAYLMVKNKLTFAEGERLYCKYVANWGSAQTVYKVEGYKNNTLVKTVIKSAPRTTALRVLPDSNTLVIGDTYDAVRIAIEAIDENGNLLYYANNALEIKVEGPIELIGSRVTSLIGGAKGIYIKTKGEEGTGKVIISGENLGRKEIYIEVLKATEEKK